MLPGNQSLVPVIKYAPDVARAGAGDDFTAEFLARRDSYDTVRRSVSNVASVSVQVTFISDILMWLCKVVNISDSVQGDRDAD